MTSRARVTAGRAGEGDGGRLESFMSICLDLVLVAIVGLCAWRGFRTGIINGVSWIVALVVAIYGANLVATAYYPEFSEMLEPFAQGVVENTLIGDDQDEDGESSSVISPDMPYEEQEKLDVYTVSKAVLKRLGIADVAAESIARETAETNERVGVQMTEELTALLCDRAAFVAVFAVAFTLIAIVFTVIGNVFDLNFGLPGHENLNHMTGAALGIIRGFVIILVLGCLGRYLGVFIPAVTMDKTLIFKHLVEANKLADILKI